jgi:hypothetical protein
MTQTSTGFDLRKSLFAIHRWVRVEAQDVFVEKFCLRKECIHPRLCAVDPQHVGVVRGDDGVRPVTHLGSLNSFEEATMTVLIKESPIDARWEITF